MPILYTYYRSSCSYRIRIALNLKGIACDFKYINLNPRSSEQKSEEYLTINAQGKVPFFVDGDIKISQSTAILEYLEEQYPDFPLLPKSVSDRAHVRQLCNIIACDVQPLNNIAVLERIKSQFDGDKNKINSWYSHWIKQGFSSLENSLSDGKKMKFSCGNAPCLFDVFLVPQIWNAIRFNVSLDEFPRLREIYDECQSHIAFKAASPEKQKDFVV